jgi:cysteine-rich PDZ-binding protein
MVCAKCQKLVKGTTLATPGVKKKSEMYHGSAASAKPSGTKSATLGQTGIGKVGSILRNVD